MSGHRNIESLLLSDGVLGRLCDTRGKAEQFSAIRASRDQALARVDEKRASDDLKPVVQAVHQAARMGLHLSRPGETGNGFMRDLLAPLVTEGTPEYAGLRSDIFDQ